MEAETPRRLWALIRHLPADSALVRVAEQEAQAPKVLSVKDFARAYRQQKRKG